MNGLSRRQLGPAQPLSPRFLPFQKTKGPAKTWLLRQVRTYHNGPVGHHQEVTTSRYVLLTKAPARPLEPPTDCLFASDISLRSLASRRPSCA
jgi:hypothetical protein